MRETSAETAGQTASAHWQVKEGDRKPGVDRSHTTSNQRYDQSMVIVRSFYSFLRLHTFIHRVLISKCQFGFHELGTSCHRPTVQRLEMCTRSISSPGNQMTGNGHISCLHPMSQILTSSQFPMRMRRGCLPNAFPSLNVVSLPRSSKPHF